METIFEISEMLEATRPEWVGRVGKWGQRTAATQKPSVRQT